MGCAPLDAYATSLSLPETSRRIISCSWKESTSGKYNSCLKKWFDYCGKLGVSPATPAVEHIIAFLTEQFEEGKSYQTILGYRSAINTIATVEHYSDICQHPLMHRFIRGVFNIRPPLPKYTKIWDVSIVLSYIRQLGDNEVMPMLKLSMKVATLLMLLSGKRCNSIDAFDIEYMQLRTDFCIFYPTRLLKHDRPGRPLKAITYRAFHQDKLLCPVQAIADYYVRRSELNSTSSKLFLTTTPPHNGASKDTIGNWVKRLLADSGVDTTIYKTHSCRAASTSKAYSFGLPLQTILAAGDWKSAETFHKHYLKEISDAFPAEEIPEVDFGISILNSSSGFMAPLQFGLYIYLLL